MESDQWRYSNILQWNYFTARYKSGREHIWNNNNSQRRLNEFVENSNQKFSFKKKKTFSYQTIGGWISRARRIKVVENCLLNWFSMDDKPWHVLMGKKSISLLVHKSWPIIARIQWINFIHFYRVMHILFNR